MLLSKSYVFVPDVSQKKFDICLTVQLNTDQYQYFVLFINILFFYNQHNNKTKQLFDVFWEWKRKCYTSTTDFFSIFHLALFQCL